jgi:hypothetical protein
MNVFRYQPDFGKHVWKERRHSSRHTFLRRCVRPWREPVKVDEEKVTPTSYFMRVPPNRPELLLTEFMSLAKTINDADFLLPIG